MVNAFSKNDFSEFPPQTQKWKFTQGTNITKGIALSTAIGLARSYLHKHGLTIIQQDSIMAIAVKQCILHGRFIAGRTVTYNYTNLMQIEYEMLHTDMMYPPCNLWRTKYGKLPELPQ